MSNFILSRGSKSLLREALAAWISLTTGTILFAIMAARFTPTMGQNVAFSASLMISVPLSVIILQAIRMGNLSLPRLPERPMGKILSEADRINYLREVSDFWMSLDADEKEGLQYLSGLIGSNFLIREPSLDSRIEQQFRVADQKILAAIRNNRMDEVPEEFAVQIGKDKKIDVLVAVDWESKKVTYKFSTNRHIGNQ